MQVSEGRGMVGCAMHVKRLSLVGVSLIVELVCPGTGLSRHWMAAEWIRQK